MRTKKNRPSNVAAEWDFDPFAEVRTAPANWDLSELLSAPRPSKNGHSARSEQGRDSTGGAAAEPAQLPLTGQNDADTPLNTMPEFWDLSEML